MAKRRKRINNKQKLITAIIILVIVVTITYGRDNGLIPEGLIPHWLDDNSSSTQNGEVYCDRVVDGDTIVVLMDGKKEKVRMIGIDTPESVHPDKSKNTPMGKIASKYTKDHLEGQYVRLETDVQERDKYGRILAYVYLDDKMFNKTLLEEGLANLMTIPPNVKYVDEFKRIESERENSY
ncbi:hypothetical protein HMPREF1635_06940 [Clostridiales bacterium S5-A14a]|nr:hypothetical protein HMPREF1635_06940 [Clostridiales bacterium S5-A14a]